jgi:hypothetical protein
MTRHFASAALLIPFVLELNATFSASKTSATKWMATAFETLATKHPEHRNRWISDDNWIEIIRNNCVAEPSKEKEKELKFNRRSMVKAVGSQPVEARRQRFHDDKLLCRFHHSQ